MKKLLLISFAFLAVFFSCMKDYSNPLLSSLTGKISGSISPNTEMEIQLEELPEVKITILGGSVTSEVEYSLSQLTRLQLLPAGPATPIGPFVSFELGTDGLLKPFTISIEVLSATATDSFFIACYHNDQWVILDTEFDVNTSRFSARTTNDGYLGLFSGTPQTMLSLICQPALLHYNENLTTFYSPIAAAAIGNVPETVHATLSFLWPEKLTASEESSLRDIVNSQQTETYPLISVDSIDSMLTNIVYQTHSADQHSDFYLKKSILNQIFQLKRFTQVTCQFTTSLSNKTRVTSFPFTLPVISSAPAIEAEHVLVPEGPYLSGQNPETVQKVAAFYIDKYEVTTQQYADFLNAFSLIGTLTFDVDNNLVKNGNKVYVLIDEALNGLSSTETGYVVAADFAQRPITGVSWYGASAYAQYHSKRLPKSQEWEKAARGMEGNLYPWGSDAPSANLCNWQGNTIATTIGSYSPQGDSPYGIADMAGNVLEWCIDTYSESDDKTLHGGFWNSSADEGGVLSSYQWHLPPDSVFIGSGFRCVQDFQH